MESPVISCFLPFDSVEQVSSTVASLKKSRYPLSIMLLLSKDRNDPGIEGCRSLFVDDLYSTETIRQIAENIPEDGYTILCSGYSPVCFGSCAIDRFIRIAEDTGSGLCYADYYKNIAGKEEKHPVIDYLSGSIRDDFDFGTILFYRNRSIREAAGQMKEIYRLSLFTINIAPKILQRDKSFVTCLKMHVIGSRSPATRTVVKDDITVDSPG